MKPQTFPAQARIVAAILAVAAASLSACNAHTPMECGPNTLGVSRTITLTQDSPPLMDLLQVNEVVLTFDDGPHVGRTPDVMAELDKSCTRATFFLLGRQAAAFPAYAKAVSEAGHSIGSHSMDHANLSQLELDVAMANVGEGHDAVEAAVGHETSLFRFPFIQSTPELSAAVSAEGLIELGITADSADWSRNSPDEAAELVLQKLEEHDRRGIILLHDPMRNSAARTRAVLDALQQNGYRVVALTTADTQIPGDMLAAGAE